MFLYLTALSHHTLDTEISIHLCHRGSIPTELSQYLVMNLAILFNRASDRPETANKLTPTVAPLCMEPHRMIVE